MYQEEQKPAVTETKSSNEILTELFSSFDVEPPLIIKKEKDKSKKHKKSKKKHKHKEKKHKNKDKKRKFVDTTDNKTKIKEERHSPPKKIKTEDSCSGEDLTPEIKREIIDDEPIPIKPEIKSENELSNEEKLEVKKKKSKIKIKSLEFSSIFEATIREIQEKQQLLNVEEGEIQSSDEVTPKNNSKIKKKHKHTHEKHKKKSSSKDRSKSHSKKNEKKESPSISLQKKYKSNSKTKYKDDFYKESHGYKSDDYSRDCSKEKTGYKPYHKENSYYKKNSRSKSHDQEEFRHHKRSENPFYRDSESSKSRDKSPGLHNEHDDRWCIKDRYRGYNSRNDDHNRRYRVGTRERDDYIDKKKLLEIARKNAIQMMKSGNLPAALTLGRQAQEKVLAAIRAGGKTIDELTEFCKTLSKKEESGELSEGPTNEDHESDSEYKAFHHPFQIKDRPSSIIMNIKVTI